MKIKNLNNLTEALLEAENEEQQKPLENNDDIIIDPKSDSIEEIGDKAAASVEIATNAEETVSEKGQDKIAAEIKETGEEVNAEAAVVLPAEDADNIFITENAITEILDDSLAEAKYAMRLGEKVNQNILISGMPGAGKTAIVENWAERNGVKLVPLNAADAKVDSAVNGMPIRNMGGDDVNEIIYSFANKKLKDLMNPKYAGNCVLFVDEFNRQRDLQLRRTFLSIFNEKRNAEGTLDFTKNLLFSVVCINPPIGKQDAGATPLTPVEMDRFYRRRFGVDSDKKTAINYWAADTANKLAKLGVDAQDAFKKLYNINLKTKSGNRRIINNIEKDEFSKKAIMNKILEFDFAMTLINDDTFEFDRESDVHALGQADCLPVTSRTLYNGIINSHGNKGKFLNWLDTDANFLRDKYPENGEEADEVYGSINKTKMIKDILADYYVDINKLLQAYGLTDLIKQEEPGKENQEEQAVEDNVGAEPEVEEDDVDLFNNVNNGSSNNTAGTISPTATAADIDQAMQGW